MSRANRARRRQHFRRDGTEKAALTQREAERRAARNGANAYRCSICGWWHIGGTTGLLELIGVRR